MEQPQHGIDYRDDGADVGLPLLLVLLTAFFVPVGLLAYLLMAVL